MTTAEQCAAVAASRWQLAEHGYRPLAVYGIDFSRPKPRQAPGWRRLAGSCKAESARGGHGAGTPDAPNTGLLCDGLRAVDIDVDDPHTAERVEALAKAMLGHAPTRTRANCGRRLLVYRAAEGEPVKRVLPGAAGKIEVLGRGQQFVAYGMHPSGAALEWRDGAPDSINAADLPGVTEDQITGFLSAAADLIGAQPDTSKADAGNADYLAPMPDATDDGELVRSIATGEGYHDSLCALAARYIGRGMKPADAVATLRGVLESIPVADRDARYRDRVAEIPRLVESALAKFAPAESADASAPQFYRDGADPYAGRNWLVYQTLPERGAALLAGVSRSGKTFCALDLALSVTTGNPFAGREIDRQGGVLYLAAEGAAEIPVRWKALKAARGYADADLPFLWTDILPCKLLEAGAAVRFAAFIHAAVVELGKTKHPLALVILDTMAVAAGWQSENDNAEASKAMDLLQSLSRATGALVLAIDHHGKNAESGTRGASAKGGNADATLALLADADANGVLSNRRLLISKSKGGPEGEIIPFALEAVTVGQDGKGRAITTCTPDWTARAPVRPQAGLKSIAVEALRVLQDMGGHATEDEWRKECDDSRRVSAAPERDSRLKQIGRAQRELVKHGAIRCSNGEVWTADAPEFAADEADRLGQSPDKSDAVRPGRADRADRQDTPHRGVRVRAVQPPPAR